MRRCGPSPRAFLLNVGSLATANLAIWIAFGRMGYPLVTASCGDQAARRLAAALFDGCHAVDDKRWDSRGTLRP